MSGAHRLVLLVAAALALFVARGARADAIAFHYGAPPVDALATFDRVVVDAENVRDDAALLRAGPQVYAYVSVGEADPTRADFAAIDARWALGENAAWRTRVMDLRRAEWRDFLIERRVLPLWKRGYRGLFLDTLDSYQVAAKDPASRAAQARGLAAIVQAIHARFPDVKLLANRGFEVLPDVASCLSGVVAESLFQGWDQGTRRFFAVREADRAWLLARLREARDVHHLPVTVIDYAPDRALQRETARKIAALGFSPWVTSSLDRLGVGELEPVPRRVLVVYDSAEGGDLAYTSAHRALAPVLEHLGFVPDMVDARAGDLPSEVRDRDAAIVTWFTDDVLPNAAAYRRWLAAQIDAGVRVAILGQLGVPSDAALLSRLGIAAADRALERPMVVQRHASWVGLEAPAAPFPGEPIAWRATSPTIRPALTVSDARGARVDAVAIAPWGGWALDPFVLRAGGDEAARWVIDPFEMMARALDLPPIPAPDLTTENGRRILTAHIDGDGFVSRAELPGAPLAARVILDRILRKYPLPTTASVIEAEVAPHGLHPELSAEAERVARAIFALPYVDVASHTYSHPFAWRSAEEDDPSQRLAVPGYTFDLHREIDGSVEYVRTLAPPGKPVKVFLWSGNALPSAEAIRMTRALGLVNVNGGDTTATADAPTLTRVAPALRVEDGEVQVYAPVQNENRYTNLWHGPFYGYRRVLETFRVTDAPRRLKPISIYYHFYSGTKLASLAALDEVYRWAVAQEILPMTLVEYAHAATAFERVSVARRLDGAWVIGGLGALRTVRVPASFGWPDPARSRGVVAVRDLPQGRYVSFGPEARAVLAPSSDRRGVFVEQANARVERWEAKDGDDATIRARLRGHAPVHLVVRASRPRATCSVAFEGAATRVTRRRDGDLWTFDFAREDTGDAIVACP